MATPTLARKLDDEDKVMFVLTEWKACPEPCCQADLVQRGSIAPDPGTGYLDLDCPNGHKVSVTMDLLGYELDPRIVGPCAQTQAQFIDGGGVHCPVCNDDMVYDIKTSVVRVELVEECMCSYGHGFNRKYRLSDVEIE